MDKTEYCWYNEKYDQIVITYLSTMLGLPILVYDEAVMDKFGQLTYSETLKDSIFLGEV